MCTSTDGKPKIFLWCNPYGGDVVGYALAEDGEGLASHLSSNESFARHDMGLTSERKHDIYAAHYPDGYNLVWLTFEEQEASREFQKALVTNKERGDADVHQD